MDDQYNRLPLPFTLNADKEFSGTPEDPLRYLTLTNVVSSPALMADGTPWRGSREISDVLYQIIIEMCSKPGVVLQIILVCKTIIQRPKRYPVNYFTVLFIC